MLSESLDRNVFSGDLTLTLCIKQSLNKASLNEKDSVFTLNSPLYDLKLLMQLYSHCFPLSNTLSFMLHRCLLK